MMTATKREYTMPVMREEIFQADEYVAACDSWTLYCAIPGQYTNQILDPRGDGTYGSVSDSEGLWHGGPCAVDNVTTDTNTGAWKETKGSTITNVNINTSTAVYPNARVSASGLSSNGSGSDQSYYFATWSSLDVNDNNREYKHYGLAKKTGNGNAS